MKKVVILACTACCALPAYAERIDQTMPASALGEISVSNIAGRVEVRGWSRDEVEVTGELGEDVTELIFERDGDDIEVKVKVPNRMYGRKDITSELYLRVPEGSALDIATVSASIEVQDVRGEQELQSVSGSIDTQVFDADVEVGTVSGSIDVQGSGSPAEIELSSVSGSISTDNIGGEVSGESVSGSMSIRGGRFESVDLETVNGRITLRGELDDRGEVVMESINGSIDIRFDNAVPADYEVETFNGRIKNCFGVKPERKSKYAPGYSLEHRVGAGTASVRVETLNGSVNFCAG